jgi:hypothetical protein
VAAPSSSSVATRRPCSSRADTFVCTDAPPPCDDERGTSAWQRGQQRAAELRNEARRTREETERRRRDAERRRWERLGAVEQVALRLADPNYVPPPPP